MRALSRVIGLVFASLCASAAHAWTFETPKGREGAAQLETSSATMAFSCIQAGSEGHEPTLLTWKIGGDALMQAVGVADGEIARIAVAIDGQSIGEGPFLKLDAQTVATSVPRDLPILAQMRAAQEISLDLNTFSMTLPLEGLDTALDALMTWCDTAPKQDLPNLVQAQCTAPKTMTDRTICEDAKLSALENVLLAAVAAKTKEMNPNARASFEAEHKDWVLFRQSCANSASCIEAASRARVAILAKQVAPAPAAAALREQPVPTALGKPIIPLEPAELSGVIWDEKQLRIKLAIEAVRARPELAEMPNVLQSWAQIALDQRATQAGQEQIARDHLLRSVAANPPGPFLIGQLSGNPVRADDYRDGAFSTTFANPGQRQNLTHPNFVVPGFGSLVVRARSDFDMTRLPVPPAQMEYVKTNAGMMRAGLVYQVDAIEDVGGAYAGGQFVARGQVRFAGLFQVAQPQRGTPAPPPRLVAMFPMSTAHGPGQGLAGAAKLLGLRLVDGRVLDSVDASGSGRQGGLTQLLQWAALRKQAPSELTDELRTLAFFSLATQRERDAVIDPYYFSGGVQRGFSFDRFVDEFERAELMDAVDTKLWPVARSRLPDLPIEVIASRIVHLSEYDRARGGFPMSVSGDAFSIARQGQYPAFRAVPDMLPLPVEKARELVTYLEATGGPGFRQLTLVAQYRIEDVGRRDPNARGGALEALVTPLGLSLHGYTKLNSEQNPLGQKIMDFDLAAYRGPERPVADPARVAFWQEVDEQALSTRDDVALAAANVADGPSVAARLAAGSTDVRNAGDFDKAAVERQVMATIAAASKPEALKLSGSVLLSPYNPEAQAFGVERVYFSPEQGSLGLGPVNIVLSDPGVLARIPADPAVAQLMARDRGYERVEVALTVWATPALASDDGRQSTLFVTPTRIVLRAPGDDGTGYPPAYIEITPEPAAQVAPGPDVAGVAMDAPTAVPLDADYLDLLALRDDPDAISDATYLRMMYDRRLRELKARDVGHTLEWGWFFDGSGAEWNPVQERAMLDRFKSWSLARAEALPEAVYVQTPGVGFGGDLACWSAANLQPDQMAQAFAQDIPGGVTLADLNRNSLLLATLTRDAGRGAHLWPVQYRAIVGSPGLAVTRAAVADSSQSACRGSNQRWMQSVSFDGAIHQNALIELRGAIRLPLPREGAYVYRDHGTVQIAERSGSGLKIEFDVTRSEVMEIVKDERSLTLVARDNWTREKLGAAPETVDLFDIAPGDAWADARAKAATRLADAIVLEEDGPPRNLRIVTQNTLFGEEQQFSALQNGHFLIDPEKGEALALLREAERDSERLIGVGSYRTFDASKVSQEALIGALLRKYGANPETNKDASFYGPRPGQTMAWGVRSGCLPQMNNEIRPNLNDLTGDPSYQKLTGIARLFRAPALQYSDQAQYVYETCTPVIWAAVGEDAEKRLHLIVWSLDLSVMLAVAQRPDQGVKVDGDAGSQELIENAADIDL